jgi:adenylylsulfate kinase-like enzyme
LGECDSFADGKMSADKQQNTVVWITGNSTGGMTG